MGSVIEQLKDLQLHDVSVNSFYHDFKNSVFKMSIDKYSEDTKDYYEVVLEFYNVTDFEQPDFFYGEDNDIEITACSTEKSVKRDNYYKIELIFLLGIGKPSLTLNFEFEGLNII